MVKNVASGIVVSCVAWFKSLKKINVIIDIVYLDGPSDTKIHHTLKGNSSRRTTLFMFVIHNSFNNNTSNEIYTI